MGAPEPEAPDALQCRVRFEPLEVGDDRGGALGEASSGRRELDLVVPADEELDPELALELLHRPADRGDRQVESPCGPPEVQLLGDREKTPHL
ncbi:MAG: hypothetical protein JWR81_1785 [Pseudonocardia sp.]|jgi:hypothetical protein|nr:hypothetical protein [Pseudonocardia sp.]